MNLALAQSYALPVVTRMLRRFPDDVQDVLQQAALKAWRARKTFRGDCSFETWFTAIAVRQALMRLRAARAGVGDFRVDSLDWVERDEDGKEQVWQLRDDGIGPEEMACREELARIVREEVGRLSEAMQEVVRLRLAEVPLDNVGKSRMFRAKRVLREKLLERGVVVLKGGREDGRQAGSPL